MLESSAEKLVETLPDGYSNYLKVQLDPYHDKTIRFEGAPTSRNATSICLCINQEMTLAADDFPGITEPTWDAHFTMYPIVDIVNCHLGDEISNVITVDETSNAIIRPLTVHGVNSGTPTYCGQISQLLIPNMLGFDLTSATTYGVTGGGPGRRCLRIVGESFEVIDESPEIYQQGAVTVYRYPLDVDPQNFMYQVTVDDNMKWNPSGNPDLDSGGNYRQYINGPILRTPPINTASAVLISGSETWKAREGAYVVGTQYASEVPFKTVDDTLINFVGYLPSVQPNYSTNGYYSLINQANIKTSAQSVETNGTLQPQFQRYNASFPYNLSGAYFTGLSAQYTVLRLRYRAYVEILTDPSDNILAPLASNTLPYNQQLQEFCMQVIAKEPAGVPQTWNPDGEKWKKVLHTIGSVADKLGPALGLIDSDLGLLIGSGGRLLKNSTKPKGKGSKKKGAPQATGGQQPSTTQPSNSKKKQAKKPAHVSMF